MKVGVRPVEGGRTGFAITGIGDVDEVEGKGARL